jgi:translation initiation factor 3 subunit G
VPQDLDKEEEPDLKDKVAAAKIVQCRICKGQHFTLKCPYKDSFSIPETDAAPAEGA